MEKLSFNIAKFSLQEISDSQLMKLEMYIVSDGDNPNRLPFTLSSIKKAETTLLGKPILFKYDNSLNDFEEHNDDEIACGYFPEHNNIRYEKQEDGKTFMVAEGIIWKHYYPEVVEIFQDAENNKKGISMEIEILDDQKLSNGERLIKEFCFLGVTLLGDKYKTGIEHAKATVIKFSELVAETEKILEKFDNKIEVTNFPNKNENKEISFSNSNFKEFDYDYALDIKENYPQIWELSKNKFSNIAFTNWGKIRNGKNNKSLNNWILRRERFSNRHLEDNNLINMIESMKWGVVVKEGEKYMKDLIDKEKNKESFTNNQNFIDKEDLGTKEAIEIDKTKESMSTSPWGDENKSQLKKDCLLCKNWKEVCKAVFLQLSEGWEEGKEGSLGYPVMEKNNNKVVYNRYALSSAKAYAEKNNENQVLTKVNNIYKKMSLDKEEKKNMKKEDKEKFVAQFGLTTNQMWDKLSTALNECGTFEDEEGWSYPKYSIYDFNSDCIYAYSPENKCMVSIPYTMQDNTPILNEEGIVTGTMGFVPDEGACDGDDSNNNLVDLLKALLEQEMSKSTEAFKKESDKKIEEVKSEKEAEMKKKIDEKDSKIKEKEDELKNKDEEMEKKNSDFSALQEDFKKIISENQQFKAKEILAKVEFSILSEEEKNTLCEKISDYKEISDYEMAVQAFAFKKLSSENKIQETNKAQFSYMGTLPTKELEDDKKEFLDPFDKIEKQINK